MPSSVETSAPSPPIQQSLLGGVAALIVGKLEAGEGEGMAELLPELECPLTGRA